MDITINFNELVNPPYTDTISGRDYGKKHAIDTKIIKQIDENNIIIIVIDENIVKAINDSFIKGYFNEVFKKLKTIKEVKKHITLNTGDYYKDLIEKNWAILEAIHNV